MYHWHSESLAGPGRGWRHDHHDDILNFMVFPDVAARPGQTARPSALAAARAGLIQARRHLQARSSPAAAAGLRGWQ
jgi:hypothetical protein